jgi:phosphatidylserine/phosphatidylglycerophosphate/cardiolipin synthase-like enzyme
MLFSRRIGKIMQTIIGKEFPKKVIPLIESSKKSIKIIVFDWRWYFNDPANPVQLFNQSLIRARRRGVNILVLTNNDAIAKILQSEDIAAKQIVSKKTLHVKMMLIDDDIVVLGSHNYTQHAFTKNFEASVLFQDAEAFQNLNTFFQNLYG